MAPEAKPRDRFCDHCALPVGAAGVERTIQAVERWFCCLGCSIAYRFGGGGSDEGGSESAAYLLRIGLGFVLSMIVMLIQWVSYFTPEAADDPTYLTFAPWAQAIACTPVFLVLGVPYLWNAIVSLRQGRIGADLLIGTGLLAGYLASWWTVLSGQHEPLFFDTVGGLATLVTVGRYIEAAAKERATQGLRSFLSGARRPARRLDGDREVAVTAAALAVGDVVRVLPGEQIAADGVVRRGRALVDEAALTGEPLPRAVAPGDTVRAPTVPTDGALEIEVEAVGEGSLLAEVGRVLSEARRRRAPIERMADHVSSIFVPAVLVIAGIVFGSDLTGGDGLAAASLHALSVLVVACPCALGIATPLAVTAALGQLARRGILVRSGQALGELKSVRGILFDKTGTLTEGRPTVGVVEPRGAVTTAELLSTAATLEQGSEHAWARGIVERAHAEGIELGELIESRVVAGSGIEGRVRLAGIEHEVQVGRAAWLGVESEAGAIAVARDGEVIGTLLMDDALRPDARAAVEGLAARGVAIHVLSGDHPARVASVAATLGLEAGQALGGLLPGDKVRAVERIRAELAGPVAFVGDGLNDAPALAAADLGIAVGSGTDLARETADISLLGGDLTRLPKILEAARRTRRTIALNLFQAFAYNGAAVAWAALFGLPPVLAALAMVVSSLGVIFGSIRLRVGLANLWGGAADT